jgi:ankyrin repeat protein
MPLDSAPTGEVAGLLIRRVRTLMHATLAAGHPSTTRPEMASRRWDSDETRILMDVLYDAMHRGDVDAVSRLLDENPELLETPVSRVMGDRPLHVAAWEGNVPMVELLLARGADVNARGDDDSTPLHNAAVQGHVAAVGPLVAAGAGLEARNGMGDTPLSVAATSRDPDGRLVVEALLDLGAPLDLHSALALGRFEDARRILAERPTAARDAPAAEQLLTTFIGAVLERCWTQDRDDNKVLATDQDLLDALIAGGAPLDYGYDALCAALELPDPSLAEQLLKAGVPTTTPHGGMTLAMAARNSPVRDAMLELLRRYGLVN